MELNNLKDNLYNRIIESNLFSNHFRSYSKQDYEILMFTVFLDSIKDYVRDYDISIALGIPESKVRNLRLKSQLLYPKELSLADELTKSLSHGYYDSSTQMITVTIEDPSVQALIKYNIEKDFGTVGRSLNSKQLILPIESFLLLAAHTENDPDTLLTELNSRLQKETKSTDIVVRKDLKARFLRSVPDIASFLNNIVTLYTVGKPIIQQLLVYIS